MIPTNRKVAREGVNAVQTFFERNDCVFQEVAQQNDFGKDAYVDITLNRTPTPLCAALQIKAGTSYRSADGDYFVPVQNHRDMWRRSTVPVFGLVYDPDDGLIRWADVTGYLRSASGHSVSTVPVSRYAILNERSLHGDFTAAVTKYAEGGGSVLLNLLADGPIQVAAVYDAWALGRYDAKYLILLRRLLLDLQPTAVRKAIHLLAHAGSHPNILWTKDNWIPQTVVEQALPTFRWSTAEIAHMIRAVDYSDYGYGTLGESLDVLLYEDSDIVPKLSETVGLLLAEANAEYAVRAATLALSHSRNAPADLMLLIAKYPQLQDHEWFEGVAGIVREDGRFSVYY